MVEENPVRLVSVNQKFVIDLEAIPGAGYMWELTSHSEKMEVVSQKVVSISKAIGGTSTQRFTLVARQQGNYSLVFELKRRWKKNSVKTSKFEIQVR
jgi:predicted secreted protein